METLAASAQVSPLDAVALGAKSLELFGHLFLPKTFRQKSPEMHKAIGQALYSPSRYNAFRIFRGGAKTTLLRAFTLQRICYAISRTGMYVGASQGHSVLSIRWLKKQIEFNRLLAPFKLSPGSKWTDEWIEVLHGVEEVPINIFAVGITGQIRGFNLDDFRPDLIVGDDLLTEENTATPDQRAKTEELFFGALVNSLAPTSEAPWAKVALLQTPMNRDDLLAKVMEDPSWKGLHFGCFDDAGKSQWPERFSTEWLIAEKESHIRRSQYRLWMREWECQIVSGEDKAIDVTKIRYWDVLPDDMLKIIAIDPASSDSPNADDHVVITVGFRGQDVYVLALHASKGVMPDAACAEVVRQALQYGPVMRVVVEEIGYQRVLKWALEQEMQRRRTFLPVIGVQDRRRKADRIMQAIPGLVSYGHLYIHTSMSAFVAQADDYDPQQKSPRDDMLDALAMAITSYNPHLYDRSEVLDGEFTIVNDEKFAPLEFGGCP